MEEHPNVVHEDDVDWEEESLSEQYGFRRKNLRSAAGRLQDETAGGTRFFVRQLHRSPFGTGGLRMT